MHNCFFGNERDFYKYALLRVLSACVNSIGVCWLLTERCTNDGGTRDYLDMERDCLESKDEELVKILQGCVLAEKAGKERSVYSVEKKGIIPKAKYFYDSFLEEGGRDCYFEKAAKKFGDCDLIFFDPNVGVMPDSGLRLNSRNHESEYIRKEEIQRMWGDCKESSLVEFQYFNPQFASLGSRNHSDLHDKIVDKLKSACKDAEILRLYRSPVAYYFMLRAEHRKERKGIVHCKMDKIERLGFECLTC